MNRHEFMLGYQRLSRACRQEVSPERAQAAYKAIRHHSAHAWEEAVDLLLLDFRLPTSDRILAAINAATDRERQRLAEKRAELFAKSVPPIIPDYDYAQARIELAKAQLAGRVTRGEVAKVLLALAERFPQKRAELEDEAKGYDAGQEG